jgi:hypothetical protein
MVLLSNGSQVRILPRARGDDCDVRRTVERFQASERDKRAADLVDGGAGESDSAVLKGETEDEV